MKEDISMRTSLLIGEEGVDRLKRSFVVLAGVGAVGGYVLEGLVRAGVGHIRVVDSDVFSESNLNRQILATKDTVGRSKTAVAVERAHSINPDMDIEAMDTMVSADTVPDILCGSPDVLADAIDTVEHKVALLRYAAEKKITTFSSMGAALHFETSSIKVATLKRTNTCPLASSVRSRLKDMDTGCITCVYSEEPVSVRPSERDERGKSILGSLPTVPAVFGMTLANEIIRYLLSKE
ncbi:MAG: tRNA threonylcarbamoyladenosine dehydratase [Candidatus Methanomethylophilaceae archaeon]|nr:tRNA threonylcarbamoyladenosine dehydratase [Candidatus Methanomethylophilaceae archaeon]